MLSRLKGKFILFRIWIRPDPDLFADITHIIILHRFFAGDPDLEPVRPRAFLRDPDVEFSPPDPDPNSISMILCVIHRFHFNHPRKKSAICTVKTEFTKLAGMWYLCRSKAALL